MDVNGLRQRLEAKAYLCDDPTAYMAGINDALDAVQRLADWDRLLRTEHRADEAPRLGTLGG